MSNQRDSVAILTFGIFSYHSRNRDSVRMLTFGVFEQIRALIPQSSGIIPTNDIASNRKHQKDLDTGLKRDILTKSTIRISTGRIKDITDKRIKDIWQRS